MGDVAQKTSKESHNKEEDLLAWTEELKDNVREASKARIKLKEGFKEWLRLAMKWRFSWS